MWIVDLINKELLLNTWVAHGNGSGDDIPAYFSNANSSYASSLGFMLLMPFTMANMAVH